MSIFLGCWDRRKRDYYIQYSCHGHHKVHKPLYFYLETRLQVFSGGKISRNQTLRYTHKFGCQFSFDENGLLKALGTFGNCQRPVFSRAHLVYPNICKTLTNLWQFGLNWLSKLQENERKTHKLHYSDALQKASAGLLLFE